MDYLRRNAAPEILSAGAIAGLLAILKIALQVATDGRYGIFRDELYYLACARHLAWGYVDHPPLIAFTAWLAAHLFGTSLFGLRLLPALAGGALVWITAQIAREMGGGRFAQSLAACSILPVPIYLMMDHWLTMNAFEPVFWMGLLWVVLRMVAGKTPPQGWLAAGALAGVGMENKYSMLIFAAAVILGLWITPQRRILKTRWFLAGTALAGLLFLPNLLWLIHHGFPFLEFERNSRLSGSRIARSPLAFVADQALIMNPLLAPLWLGGLLWLLLASKARRYRFAGWTFLAVFLLLLLLKAKNYYAAPAYPVLFAAGSIAIEAATARGLVWVRGVYIAAVLLAGLLLAPFVLPVLSVQRFLAYQKAWGGFNPIRMERLPPALLPQQFADEFGWESMARETAQAYAAIPAAERQNTAIFANNYGEAAAIDFFGKKYGLPAAIGNNESYWLWGPRSYNGESVLVLGSDGSGDREHFQSVEVVGRVDHPYARSEERFDIYLCRHLSADLRAFWPRIKNW